MQFIELSSGFYKNTNLMPDIVENFFVPWTTRNYRPDLIIRIGESNFYHREEFMINEAYPRFIPSYSVFVWNTQPNMVQNDDLTLAKNNFKRLKLMIKIYHMVKNKPINNDNGEKILWLVKKIQPIYLHETTVGLVDFLDRIQLEILGKKYLTEYDV